MVSLILLGFSLSMVDGTELKMCHYRVPGYGQSVSLSRPTWDDCPLEINIGTQYEDST